MAKSFSKKRKPPEKSGGFKYSHEKQKNVYVERKLLFFLFVLLLKLINTAGSIH